MKLLEFITFSSLAVGLHIGAVALWPAQDGASSGGQAGTQTVTIASASANYASLIGAWEKAPMPQGRVFEPVPTALPIPPTSPTRSAAPDAAQQRSIRPDLPTAPAQPDTTPVTHAPQPPLTVHIPNIPISVQNLSSPLPQPEPVLPPTATPPPQPLSPSQPAKTPEVEQDTPDPQGLLATSKRPKAAPRRPEPQTARTSPPKPSKPRKAQASTKAAGTGNSATAGQNTQKRKAVAAKPSTGQNKGLKQAWAARIKAKIQRKMPRVADRSKAHPSIRVKVSNKGKLLGVSLLRSSGSPKFDQHALQAARAARVFPRAPKGLELPYYQFHIRVKYN